MITISAKDLRQNLSEYLKRAMHGEEIEVIYRSRPAVKLSPLSPTPSGPVKGSPAAFRASMAALEPMLAGHHSTLNSHQSVKELYRSLRDDDAADSPERHA